MMDYAEEVEQFMSESDQYIMEVERVIEVNTIVETIVTAVSWHIVVSRLGQCCCKQLS